MVNAVYFKGDKRKMIIEVVGKEIEKIKGDFESYLNGLNMVGEISYSQYSELYDEGTKQIQRAYELGKSELEKENAELKAELSENKVADCRIVNGLCEQLTKAKELLREIIDTPVFNQMSGELYENEGYTELVEEAEQFLSEVENDSRTVS